MRRFLFHQRESLFLPIRELHCQSIVRSPLNPRVMYQPSGFTSGLDNSVGCCDGAFVTIWTYRALSSSRMTPTGGKLSNVKPVYFISVTFCWQPCKELFVPLQV
jgi:hypothetical protein